MTDFDELKQTKAQCLADITEALPDYVNRLNSIDKRSKPVQQLDADGNVVAEYPSTIEAERVTGTNRYQIRMCCNGKYKTAGGYRWKFKEQ